MLVFKGYKSLYRYLAIFLVIVIFTNIFIIGLGNTRVEAGFLSDNQGGIMTVLKGVVMFWIINLMSKNSSEGSNDNFLTSTIQRGLDAVRGSSGDNSDKTDETENSSSAQESASKQEQQNNENTETRTGQVEEPVNTGSNSAKRSTDSTQNENDTTTDNNQTGQNNSVDDTNNKNNTNKQEANSTTNNLNNNDTVSNDTTNTNNNKINTNNDTNTNTNNDTNTNGSETTVNTSDMGIRDIANIKEQNLLNLINKVRKREGIRPLEMNSNLIQIARRKATDMIENDYFTHNSPIYGSPFDMLKEEGVDYGLAGENLARAETVEEGFAGLMESPEHKDNILNTRYDEVGIGIVEGGPYGLMIVQLFIDDPDPSQ